MIEFSLMDLTTTAARSIAWLVIGGALLQNFTYLVQLAVAQRSLAVEPPEPHSDVLWRRSISVAPPITLMAPAYNEAATVENSVLSLLALDYPRFEVIVINDGSKDETLNVLKERFDLVPVERDYERVASHAPIRAIYRSRLNEKLLVIDKANGGKADALNAGLNLARTPIVCSMDADSILEPDSLLRAVQPFIEDPERVVAVGGTIRIANGCKIKDGRLQAIGVSRNPLALFQTVEYLRAFLLARSGLEPHGRSHDYLRRLRAVPAQRACRDRRICSRDGRRRHGARRPTAPARQGNRPGSPRCLSPRARVLDRGARDDESPWPTARTLAPRRD